MHSIVIYYFSGTGNTKRIVDLYQDYFCQHNASVTLVDISHASEPVATPDAVGFAYPIHGFNTPELMEQFACRLANVNNVYTFIIKTSGEPLTINNASSRALVKMLSKKGYNVCQEHHYIMPYNMVFRHTDAMATKMLKTAQRRIPSRAQDIIDKRVSKLRFSKKARLMARLCKIERVGFRLNGRLYKVNTNKCIACKQCVNACPTQNISFSQAKFKFGGHCIGCARCFFNCPVDAISIGLFNSLKVNGRYNFDADDKDAVVGKYCHASYTRYFSEEKI